MGISEDEKGCFGKSVKEGIIRLIALWVWH